MWFFSQVATALLSNGANASIANQFGVTPLHYASQNSKYDLAKMLIANGASTSVEAQNGRKPFEMAKEDEMRLLCGGPSLEMHGAVKARDLSAVQALVSDGYDVAECDQEGNSPLHLAVQAAVDGSAAAASSSSSSSSAAVGDGLAIVASILGTAAGRSAHTLTAALHTHGSSGLLPLHIAAAGGHLALVGALLGAGAPASAKTRLQGKMFNGDWARRATDGSLTELSSEGKTALHLALEFLEQNDDDESDEDEEGGGEKAGGDGIVKLLLAHRAEVNAQDCDMGTPLHQALHQGLHEVASLLLSAHANPTLGCKAIGMQNTCLHQATLKGDAKMVRLLLAASSPNSPCPDVLDVNAPGRDGWTPLCLAARSGCVPVAKELLAAGASTSVAMATSGKTALEIATVNKKSAFVKLLEAKGAEATASGAADAHSNEREALYQLGGNSSE